MPWVFLTLKEQGPTGWRPYRSRDGLWHSDEQGEFAIYGWARAGPLRLEVRDLPDGYKHCTLPSLQVPESSQEEVVLRLEPGCRLRLLLTEKPGDGCHVRVTGYAPNQALEVLLDEPINRYEGEHLEYTLGPLPSGPARVELRAHLHGPVLWQSPELLLSPRSPKTLGPLDWTGRSHRIRLQLDGEPGLTPRGEVLLPMGSDPQPWFPHRIPIDQTTAEFLVDSIPIDLVVCIEGFQEVLLTGVTESARARLQRGFEVGLRLEGLGEWHEQLRGARGSTDLLVSLRPLRSPWDVGLAGAPKGTLAASFPDSWTADEPLWIAARQSGPHRLHFDLCSALPHPASRWLAELGERLPTLQISDAPEQSFTVVLPPVPVGTR